MCLIARRTVPLAVRSTFLVHTSLTYTVPSLRTNKILSWAARDWTVGAFLAYSSGLPILAPAANNALASLLFRGTFANRVPGEPLSTQDLNCHCFDPNKEFVLNPKAWTDPAQGQWAPVRHTIATTGSNAVPRKPGSGQDLPYSRTDDV